MKTMLSLTIAFAVVCAVRSETVSGLESYGDLTLVDSIDCATDAAHEFHQYPDNASSVTTVLGESCRTMPHIEGSASYFSYRLGAGKGLVAGDMYLLVVEYPDDVPRTMTLINRAMDSRNGFHTGNSVGDAIIANIIPETHCESLEVPLSRQYRRLEQLMVLNKNVYPYDGSSTVKFLDSETDGFDIIFQLFKKADSPDSAGAAIKSIRLYRVNDESSVAATINYPRDAPRRYITWREEMSQESGYEMNADRYQNARIKTRLMKALGINCFSRDLLEFGYCQWWDDTCDGKYSGHKFNGGNDYYSHEIEIYGAAGIYLLPYYEYGGSRGGGGLGTDTNHRSLRLFEDTIANGTHFNGFVANNGNPGIIGANVDVTDPDAYDDFCMLLDCTLFRYTNEVQFVGAWIRNRDLMPMSFSDNTLNRFCEDTHREKGSVTRASIIQAAKDKAVSVGARNATAGMSDNDEFRYLVSMYIVPEIYEEYRAWWYAKRRDFFTKIQKRMSDSGLHSAKLFYTGTAAEGGLVGKKIDYYVDYDNFIAAQSSDWKNCLDKEKTVLGIQDSANRYVKNFLKNDDMTWCPAENNHAAPKADPENYKDVDNVALAYPYNCVYTTIPDEAAKYRNATDDLFFTRHYCLYEGCDNDVGGNALNGYYTCEMDRADRASVLPELSAMAYQDPTTIGFLQGNHLARNFTRPFREFNENFLALPAVKGTVLKGGSYGEDVTIRKYEVNGDKYYAVINVSGAAKTYTGTEIASDVGSARLFSAVQGAQVTANNVPLEPYQLLTLTTVASGSPQDDTPRCEFGEIEAAVDLGGTNATIRTTVVDVNGEETKVELKVNGVTVNTWNDIRPADVLEFKTDVSRGSTNVYAFVFTSGAVEVTSDPGAFVATTYTDWFTVDFEGDEAYKDGTDWTNIPADRGTWTATGESELKGKSYVTFCDSLVTYRPTEPSEVNADAKVWGRTKVTPGGLKVDLSDKRPCVAITFVDLVPHVYVDGAWLALQGGTPLVVGSPVDYTLSFRFMDTSVPPTVMFTVGDWTSQWVSAADMPRKLSALDFGGDGEFGSFRGAYYSLLPENAAIELVMPEFTTDGSALELKDAKFSMTIGNPVKDAYYTVFIAEKLTGTFKAAKDSERFKGGDTTLTLTVDADKPSLFAKIVISLEKFEIGAPLP